MTVFQCPHTNGIASGETVSPSNAAQGHKGTHLHEDWEAQDNVLEESTTNTVSLFAILSEAQLIHTSEFTPICLETLNF